MRTTPVDRIARYRSRGWWSDETVAGLFERAVAAHPSRTAVIDPANREALGLGAPRRLAFAELDSAVSAMAAQLVRLGLRPGDVVLAQLPNTWECVALYLAAARLGVVLSPVAMQYRRHELGQIAALLEPRAVVTCRAFKEFDHAALAADLASEHGAHLLVMASDGAGDASPPALATGPASDADVAAVVAVAAPSADDVFTICWTSGTEGAPKGVPRSHNQWLAISHAHFEAARIAPGDKLLNPFPMINMAAIGGCFLSWLHAAGTLLLHHPFDPQVYLQQIAVERPQYAIAPPAVLNLLIRDEALLAKVDLSSLRCIGSGSAPLAPAMIAGFRERLGIEVVNLFGSNEGVSLVSGPDEIPDPERRARYFPRFGRSDVPWPHRVSQSMETRIVDPETGGEILEPGRPGELHVRGATVFDGYFKAPEMTQQAFTPDGFFRTGDLFEIAADEQGPRYYRFAGRHKQIIVRGGMKISPEELDEILAACPGLVEGAVVGYPDEVMGERICAVVVPKPGVEFTVEQLAAHFESRGAAVFKRPERVRVVTQLPRNPVGKVARAELLRIALAPQS
ncbi:MAG: acyl--CoA ligase [Steroidobacteraceae bacterium]|nr:acyl--CoA ligase [Steroidobacteraceae bacterium]